MYLAGYIEQLGTGTEDMLKRLKESGLSEPDFIQEQDFKVIIYRTSQRNAMQDTMQDIMQVSTAVKNLILAIEGEK